MDFTLLMARAIDSALRADRRDDVDVSHDTCHDFLIIIDRYCTPMVGAGQVWIETVQIFGGTHGIVAMMVFFGVLYMVLVLVIVPSNRMKLQPHKKRQ